jgi:hypothetical protein
VLIIYLREFKIFITTFLINLVVRELSGEYRAAEMLRRHIVVPSGGGGGEGAGALSFFFFPNYMTFPS